MQDSDIRSLVAMGDHIAAIRSYVERHGVNLIAARAAIEAMRWELTQARGTGLGEVEREVDRLLKSGDRLGAIRHHRQASGGSLQASVEAIAARDKTAAPVAPESVDGRIAAGEKIAAIKRYRELSRSELKQAKDAVEARIAALAAGAAPSGDDWVPRPPPKLAP
jgi:ribosomal protein L7/L12